ncbi:MAG: alpha/beta hydrolase [Novosphingobium sp.]
MSDEAAKAEVLAMFRAATPEANDAPIEQWRAGFEAMAAKIPLPSAVAIEALECGGVPCLKVTAPGARADRLVVHYHSGGYVMGSANAYREFAGRLSKATNAPVILPDYRLAPENPYPAAADDGLAVYEWALAQTGADNLLLSGDSAGGGLCMATLMNARDRGLALPVGGIGIGPLLDLAGEGGSANIETDPLIARELIVGMGAVYIGERDPHDHPLASPLWGQHHGLPPILLMASSTEALRDDSVRMATSIAEAKGRVRLSLYDDQIHIFPFFPMLQAAGEAMNEIADFASACFGE